MLAGLRILLGGVTALVLIQCGPAPGPGPSADLIAKRTKGHEVGTFETHDGKELAYIVHRASRPNPHRAAFLYLHGIESHSEWFDEAAQLLAQKGYPVFSLDRRGSGINRENRGYISGHVERGTNLVGDIHQAVQLARKSGEVEEIYLIGLSWGGKYVMAYDAVHPSEVDGIILITPGMKPKVDLTFGEKIAVFVDLVVDSKRQHRIPITPEMFTTNPEHLAYIKQDKLKLETVSAGFLWQSLRMDSLVNKLDDGKHPPLLAFLAGHDQIIDNEATRELLTRDPERDVTLIDYPEQTHSVQLDAPGKLTRDIVEWIDGLPR